MGKHGNAKYDDETWRGYFARWHAGESAKALKAEAGVHSATWTEEARRLGMRLKDLPADHPGRRRVPRFEDRPDDYKHPNSLLDEGQWKTLFRLRAQRVPDRELSRRFGVHAATICSQAAERGLKREDLKTAAAAILSEAGLDGAGLETCGPEGAEGGIAGEAGEEAVAALAVLGVALDRRDREGSMARFDDAIEAVAQAGDMARVVALCEAKLRVDRAMFAGVRGGGGASPPHPLAGGEDPPPEGEGEAGPALALRAAQRPPEGEWTTWLFLGGRGAGKTLAGASWLADQAEALGPRGRLALIGPTLHDVREVMIDGVSGIASLPRWTGGRRPAFEPSRRRLTFPNGAVAHAFSAEDPDSLRGPQFAAAWADEFCAWRGRGGPGETLALLRMGLRLGTAPRLCVTTTPKPLMALRRLRAEPGLKETHAGTRDNAEHLSPGFVAGLETLYGGTRRAAQELEGRVVEGDGALFTAEMLMRAREGAAPDGEVKYDRVVVAVDPTTTAGGNACGIVAAGRIGDLCRVLADRSAAGLSPDGWARRVVRAAEEFKAQAVVVEVNQGGEMVKAVLRAAGCATAVREVRASKGKRIRAEPVAALYEQGRVRHAGDFPALEEELMALGGEDEGAFGLDRADALVWAVTDLLVDRAGADDGPRITVLDWGLAPPGMVRDSWPAWRDAFGGRRGDW